MALNISKDITLWYIYYRTALCTVRIDKLEALARAVKTNLVQELNIFPEFQFQRSIQNQIYWDSRTINVANNTIHLKEISSTMELHSSLCNENECYDFQKIQIHPHFPRCFERYFHEAHLKPTLHQNGNHCVEIR